MFRRRKALWSITLVVLAGTLGVISGITAGQKKVPSQEPTVDFTDLKSNSPERQAKGRRYDRPKSQPVTELPNEVELLPVNVHWWKGLPALPVGQSDAVVVGSVRAGKAYLSNDRSAVYSEFPVQVDDVLKNESSIPLYTGASVIAERWGGAVRFASGKVQRYRVEKRGVPQPNEKYVLFLKFNGKDYDLITGYSIKDGYVKPLDGDGDLQFSKYANTPTDSFLNELREAIITSYAKGAEMK